MTDSARQGPPERTMRETGQRRLRAMTYTAVFMVLVGAVLFALIPLAEADNRAYAAAPACPAGARADDCRARVTATVLGKKDEPSGKHTDYYLRLVDRAMRTDQVRLPDGRHLWEAVGVGDQVTVVYWQGEARQLRLGSLAQDTWRSPASDGRLPGAFAFSLLPFGLGLLSFCWWQRYRAGAKAYSAASAAGLVAGLMVGCVGFTLCLVGNGSAGQDVWQIARICVLSVVPAVVLSAVLSWWVTRRMRRMARKVVPVEPAGRRCLLAIVHGGVPYSVPGYCYLVVGDGPPAVTPDPTGGFARIALPPTLTVREVRPLTADDPAGWHGNYKDFGVVIACVDTNGDVPVRVAASRKTAPLVLGALLEAAAAEVG
ncbi:hypothetical protein ABZ930_13395 [Streptomyces sp. NPDC046716]|uniref:hypothetical protein n=1 Tax=Streptomyces sp. NPDC046716 TaxID=3157093 RepID=UPI00340E9416